mgnify:CR=1 FL=1
MEAILQRGGMRVLWGQAVGNAQRLHPRGAGQPTANALGICKGAQRIPAAMQIEDHARSRPLGG